MNSETGILINYFTEGGALSTGRYLKINDQLCVGVNGDLQREYFAVIVDEDQQVIQVPAENIIGLAEFL